MFDGPDFLSFKLVTAILRFDLFLQVLYPLRIDMNTTLNKLIVECFDQTYVKNCGIGSKIELFEFESPSHIYRQSYVNLEMWLDAAQENIQRLRGS